jgi:hypothetical protein
LDEVLQALENKQATAVAAFVRTRIEQLYDRHSGKRIEE